MITRRGPPSQGWRTFLRNHAPDIAAMESGGQEFQGINPFTAAIF
jgi:hypothetical protein